MARSRTRPVTRLLLSVVLLAVGTVMALHLSGQRQASPDSTAHAESPRPQFGLAGDPAPAPRPQPSTQNELANAQAAAPTASADQLSRAEQNLRRGLEVYAQGGDANVVEARRLLSAALASGALPGAAEQQCRQTLIQIADQVVFGRKIFDTDPYAYRYVVKPGDTLVAIARREGLSVPAEAVQRVNGITNPRALRVGQWLKLVKGPFHAIVTKRSFTLDLYQQDMFVRSYRVGLGQDGSTPVGSWDVSERIDHATWNPPPSAGQTRTAIYWGQPDYPLGRDGLWIALRGTDANTSLLTGFGIHGTNEPESIGQQSSLGCVRLDDDSIAEVFAFLLPGGSKVEIRP